jgi:hypothetical protein
MINFNKIYIAAAVFCLSSCYAGSSDHLYDKVGQDPEDVARSDSGAAINRNVPNYYYRYGPTVPAAPQYQQPYPPQQYAPYPQQQRGYAQPYQGQAGSRFYSNPYDIPPSPYYNQPYDADQYYVPPSYYYNEGNQPAASSQGTASTRRY